MAGLGCRDRKTSEKEYLIPCPIIGLYTNHATLLDFLKLSNYRNASFFNDIRSRWSFDFVIIHQEENMFFRLTITSLVYVAIVA